MRDRGTGGAVGAPRGGGPRDVCQHPAVKPEPSWVPHAAAQHPGPLLPWWHLHNHLYMLIGMEEHQFSPIPSAGC